MDEEKIKRSFLNVKKDMEEIKIRLAKLEGMIMALGSSPGAGQERLEVRGLLREVTSRSASPKDDLPALKSVQRKVLKHLNTAQLMKSIKHYIDEGYATNQIKDEIMTRFNIKETCFFKYLKSLRGVLREPTSRSGSHGVK